MLFRSSQLGNVSTVLDSIGNKHVCWIDHDGNIQYSKNYVIDTLQTWTAQKIIKEGLFGGAGGDGSRGDVSMTVDANNILYILTNDFNTKKTVCIVSRDLGETWEDVDSHDTPAVVDEHLRTRWSYLNHHNPNKIDYTVFNETAEDTNYNSGQFTGSLRQTEL